MTSCSSRRARRTAAIIGYDTRFFDWMAKKLFAHRPDMADNYARNPALTEVVAFRNGTLQGAYFMLAARAVGLDVGGTPSSSRTAGSSPTASATSGDPAKVMTKLPRLDFDEACTLL